MTDVAAQQNLDIKVVDVGKESTSKAAVVGYRGVQVRTPTRSLTLSPNPMSESRVLRARRFRGLNEVYKRLGSDTVDDIDGSLAKQQGFQARLIPPSTPAGVEDELLLTVFSLEDRAPGGGWRAWIPNRTQLDYISDFLFGIPHNNIVVPPAIRGVDGATYLRFLEAFFERVPSHQKKPVAGLVPNQSHREISAILDFYLSMGVTSYVLDFQGRTPLTNWSLLPAFSSHLWKVAKEHGPHYAHALNVRYGMKRDKAGFVPARDLLLILESFDSFGAVHSPPPLSKEFRKKIEEGDVQPTKVRLFDPGAYGYRQPSNPERELSAACAQLDIKAEIPAGALSDPAGVRAASKAVNAALLVQECKALSQRIRDGREVRYVGTKAAVSADVERILEVRTAYGPTLKESTIDEWV